MDTSLSEAAAGRATLVSWTLDHYHRAIVSGVVPKDSSVELLEGFIVRGRLDDYLEFPPHAADTRAVIEVADGSQRLDLGPKLQAYARAGVPQYVVVNLVDDVVLVHERPAEGGYEDVTRLVRGDTLRVRTARQSVAIPVDQLLP